MMIEAPEACRPGSQHITHSFCIHSPSSPGCGITNTGVCAGVRSLVTRYRVLLQPRCWCHKCRLMSPLSCSARRRDTPGMRGATWGAAQPPEPPGAGDTAAPAPVPQTDPSVPQPVFTITERVPTRAFFWLKAPTSAFTFKTLC